MARCKHRKAYPVSIRAEIGQGYWINVICPDCSQGWAGSIKPWYSSRGRLHKPPAWVVAVWNTYKDKDRL